MKKKIKLNKEEAVVLILGILVIVVIVSIGLAMNLNKEEDTLPVSNNNDGQTQTETNNHTSITLTKSEFKVEVNTKLDEKKSTYIDATDAELMDMKIDFSSIDMKKTGSYEATITKGKETLKLPITVVDTTPPVINVKYTDITFTIEKTSTIEEVIQFFDPSISDNYDGESLEGITGWPTQLPDKSVDETYTLTVKDVAGNVGEKKITIKFIK